MQFPFITNASLSNNGKYFVQVTSAKGCASIDSVVAAISIKPLVKAGADAEICEGSDIQLQSTGSNIVSYLWNPQSEVSNPVIPNPVAYPKNSTLYLPSYLALQVGSAM